MDTQNSDEGNENTNELPPEFVTVCKVDDVKEGEGSAFEVDGRMVALFKVAGQFHAIEDQCPHMGAALSTGFVEDCVVACPWHAWRFDVRDGSWCDNPRVKIDAFETKVEDGVVQIAKTPKKIQS